MHFREGEGEQGQVERMFSIFEERNVMDRGTERIRHALEAIGNPENSFPIIMVGGTNGKTCTSYFISQLLKKTGIRVGTFTSPHPGDICLEIQINGAPIFPEEYAGLVVRFADGNDGLTSFELKVCAALEYFREKDVGVAVMEMGMGGKGDAVNVRSPDLAVITNVSLEHTDHLGDTLEEIVREKGDIIPEHGTLVTSADRTVIGILEEIAHERGSEVITPEYEEYLPHLYHLMVDHHKENACLAMESVRRFSFLHAGGIPGKVSTVNLLNWAAVLSPPPGRFQVIPLDDGTRLILDGAHNPGGFEVLFRDLERFLDQRSEVPLVVVVGILNDKDITAMAERTKNVPGKYFCTAPSSSRAKNPEAIAAEFRTFHRDVFVAPNVGEALEMGDLMLKGDGGLMLVTGSLYTVADAREWLGRRLDEE